MKRLPLILLLSIFSIMNGTALAHAADVFDEIAGPEEQSDEVLEDKPSKLILQIKLSPTYRVVKKIQVAKNQEDLAEIYMDLESTDLDLPYDDRILLRAFLANRLNLKFVSQYWLRKASSNNSIDLDVLNLWRTQLDPDLFQKVSTNVREGQIGKTLLNSSGIQLKSRDEDFYRKMWFNFLTSLTQDQVKTAVKILREHFLIEGSIGAKIIGLDNINLNIGRALYQAGYLKDSRKYYNKIAYSSILWSTAEEENTWIDLREGRFAEALARGKTLTNSFLSNYVNSEAFYLTAISALKICNYTDASRTVILFKKIFQPRYHNLKSYRKKVATLNSTKAFNLISELVESHSINLKLPVVRNKVRQVNQLVGEVKKISNIYKKHKKLKSENLTQIRKSLASRTEMIIEDLKSKTLHILDVEIEEIKQTVNYMHVLEAEMLQQIVERRTFKMPEIKKQSHDNIKKGKWDLIFPYDARDNWFDELNTYQVSTNSLCLTQIKGGKNEKIKN